MLTLAACSDQVLTPTGDATLPDLTRTRVVAAGAEPNAVLRWNQAALDAVSASTLGPPMVARALALVHTAIYDAWAAYHPVALGTVAGGALRRPAPEHTDNNKIEALSYAAFQALVDLFPAQRSRFEERLQEMGFDPANTSEDPTTPAGIGNLVGRTLMTARHQDGSNQLGTLGPTGQPYSDYTGYVAVNTPDEIHDPNAWQPLRHPNKAGTGLVSPAFVGPHWDRVTPFALARADQLRPPPPRYYPHGLFRQQAEELIRLSAGLTDREKVIAEYWADGPGTVLPPGHFNLFAQWVSLRDGHGLDEDAAMFFILTNAVFDAGIACWDAKIHYNSARPISAIRFLKQGRRIRAWAGPGQGTRVIRGEEWRPYQPEWFPTPPFPEYVSGHSSFSAAAAEILRRFTGSDAFGASVTITTGDLGVEPGVPAKPVVLSWPSFTAAADEAGMSRRYGGIHFRDGDLEGRRLGRRVADLVWQRAMEYLTGQGAG